MHLSSKKKHAIRPSVPQVTKLFQCKIEKGKHPQYKIIYLVDFDQFIKAAVQNVCNDEVFLFLSNVMRNPSFYIILNQQICKTARAVILSKSNTGTLSVSNFSQFICTRKRRNSRGYSLVI